MGNDGGSIPTRRELVKQGAKDLTTTQVKEILTEQQEHFWKTCALSHEPLSHPVVSDGLGTLYNKAAVLDHLLLLSKENLDREVLVQQGEALKDRIRSLKDIVDVKFHSEKDEAKKTSKWVCPVTNKVLGPGTKAVYIVPCGHAFAESVVKEMTEYSCVQCNEVYTHENVISILPTSQAEKDRLVQRLQDLRASGLAHSLKKLQSGGKKRKKAGLTEVDVKEGAAKVDGHSGQKVEGIRNTDTATLTYKVLAEQEDSNKRRKMNANANVKGLFSTKKAMEDINTDFMSRGFSFPAKAKQ